MVSPLRQLLTRQARRLRFYRLVSTFSWLLLSCFAWTTTLRVVEFILLTFQALPLVSFPFWAHAVGWTLLAVILMGRALFVRLHLVEAAAAIEQQDPFFARRPERRSELQTAAQAIVAPEKILGSDALLLAHRDSWSLISNQLAHQLAPTKKWYGICVLGGLSALLLPLILNAKILSFPQWVKPQTVRAYELKLAFDETWSSQAGAPYGISGSWVRFPVDFSWGLRPFLFVRSQVDARWTAVPCAEECVYQLKERGEFAIGSSLYRSPVFPLIVIPDEAPKALILVEWKGDIVAAPTLLVKEKDRIAFLLSARDDIRLREVQLLKKVGEVEEVLLQKTLGEAEWKANYILKLEGWKEEETQIILRVRDDLVSTDSTPLVLKFDTEEQKRERRIQNLRAVVSEWVHILADLLETEELKRPHAQLKARLAERSSVDAEGDGLVAAYYRELDLLAKRIEGWVVRGQPLGEVKSLVERTERQVLYGLSLIFQEKTGDVGATTQSLQSSQQDLNSLLQKVKDGKLELSSEALKEAFQKLEEKLAELQSKIRNLPQGPSDDLINREALEAQADESQSLQDRIEDIQKQIAEGKNAEALRELESLLNQLSILSKEMERNLEQVQSNLDRGAIQSATAYMKKLQELRKREETLSEKTAKTRRDLERADEAGDLEKQKQLESQLEKQAEEQKAISDEFQKNSEAFSEQLKGTEWSNLFRNEEATQQEEQISQSMREAQAQLSEKNPPEALVQQKDAVERLRKLEGSYQEMIQQIQSQAQSMKGYEAQQRKEGGKVEILSSQGKGERERKQKIIGSLKQKVDERYQKSHEGYFEELLQR